MYAVEWMAVSTRPATCRRQARAGRRSGKCDRREARGELPGVEYGPLNRMLGPRDVNVDSVMRPCCG
jgi:hypothetical protein